MFWDSFFGSWKGTFLFWDKIWGIMGKISLCERIVSILAAFKWENPGIMYMQDRAPSYSANQTIENLHTVRIVLSEFLPPLPSLNSIKNVWNSQKKFLQYNFPEPSQRTRLRVARVCKLSHNGWDSIDSGELWYLIESIRRRCQQVLEAKEKYMKLWESRNFERFEISYFC